MNARIEGVSDTVKNTRVHTQGRARYHDEYVRTYLEGVSDTVGELLGVAVLVAVLLIVADFVRELVLVCVDVPEMLAADHTKQSNTTMFENCTRKTK